MQQIAQRDADNIKLDKFGEMDYQYYINRAHKMRAAAAAELTSQFASWIKQSVKKALHIDLRPVSPA